MNKMFEIKVKDSKSIFLTFFLLFFGIVFLSMQSAAKGISLWVDVAFFTIINIGFLVALILGVRTKNKSIMLFSVLLNSAFLTIGMLFIYMYLFLIVVI